MKEATRPAGVTDNQNVPVAVSVKGKPRAAGLDHGRLILLIEHIACINEEEYPIILPIKLLLQEVHHVDYTFYTRLYPDAQLLLPAGLFCLWSDKLQNALFHQPTPSFSYS